MSQTSAATAGQEIGRAVSDFSLPVIGSGEQCALADLQSGKRGVLVVFWSGICSHCLRYDQYLNTFAARHPEFGFAAIASRQGESADMIRASAVERNLSFPILYDADGAVARAWYTQQTPRAFLVDSNRTLLYRGRGNNRGSILGIVPLPSQTFVW